MQPKIKIHLVDDEPVLLWIIKEYLEAHGFVVATDTDPHASLQQMQRSIPALAVLDILMPGMDGFSLFEQMRDIPALARVPVIFLTAFSDLPARLKGLQVGAEDYICKPFEVSELEARIKAILWRTENVNSTGAPYLDTVHSTLYVEGIGIFLTQSEVSLMEYFLTKQNTLITTDELLHHGLGYADETGSLATVRYHIRNLRKKLNQANLSSVNLETIGHSGYMFSIITS